MTLTLKEELAEIVIGVPYQDLQPYQIETLDQILDLVISKVLDELLNVPYTHTAEAVGINGRGSLSNQRIKRMSKPNPKEQL